MFARGLMSPAAERFGRAQVATLPPPVGGWNDRDSLDQMQAMDAVDLKNWFPRTHDIVMRKGYAEYADTGETGQTVESLHEHHGSSSSTLLAGVNNKLFDVSTNPAAPSSGREKPVPCPPMRQSLETIVTTCSKRYTNRGRRFRTLWRGE